MSLPDDYSLLYVSHGGVIEAFDVSTSRRFSSFGGPMKDTVSGLNAAAGRLHLVADLVASELPVLREHQLVRVPLAFGLTFDGCSLKYKIDQRERSIIVQRVTPKKAEPDWPYRDYPVYLPFYHLQPVGAAGPSIRKIMEDLGIEREAPEEIVVLVPPPRNIGMSLWLAGADADYVIVWRCNLKSRLVCADVRCY